ncbi:protein DGCR14 [Trifolium pratense]|uniref:Protein DGCR14 n=1 Tax=Trifolium pratense TaxID=57577 RepID=A0A2K3MN80_TRIPR|nr:protein DGCR14 [Trifolium pratense]
MSKNKAREKLVAIERHPPVLDEDTYAEALEKIIERDYFPDISKLRDRLDLLEAIKTGDPFQIREAYSAWYTSEDNQSFWKILERVNRKRKERFGYLNDSVNGNGNSIEDEKRDRITDGYVKSYQPPSTLEGFVDVSSC